MSALQAVPRQPLFVEVQEDFYEFKGQTFEEHVDAWQIVDSQVQKDKWKLGTVAASLRTKYDDKTIKRFAHEVRRSTRRVWEYAQTYRAFEKCERSHILSFHHHTKAAAAEDPQLAIQKAEDGEWSTRELEHWIKTGEEPQPKTAKEPETVTEAMKAIHEAAVKAELTERIAVLDSWTEPVSPLLSVVYEKLKKILEWQRDRTIEEDCNAIMKMFSGDEGTEAPERANDRDIAAWLHSRGMIMTKEERGTGGCAPNCSVDSDGHKHIKPSGRLGLMIRLKMLTVESREESRHEGQRGDITCVYAAERDYLGRLDDLADMKKPERDKANRKDWAERIERYAPELMPKDEKKEAA